MKISRLKKRKFNIIYIIGRKILFCSLCAKKAALQHYRYSYFPTEENAEKSVRL
mgnify:CR=1 FL=1